MRKSLYADASDIDFINAFCKKNGISIRGFVSNVVSSLKLNKDLLKEVDVLRKSELEEFSDQVTLKLSDTIRKNIVKENNRILGFHIYTDKRIKAMYRDLIFHIEKSETDKFYKHPFWEEYEFQNIVIRHLFRKKFNITTDDDLMNVMREVLGQVYVDDYMLSINRTRSRTLTTIR